MWQRPTIAKIDLNAIRNNYRALRGMIEPSVKILSVVKADGYGHGAVQVSHTLAAEGIDWFGVAIPEEGVQLRESGISTPILSLGGIYNGGNVNVYERYSITPVVFEPEIIEVSRPKKGPLKVHLKVDTGMGRLGATEETLDDCLAAFKKNPSLELEGVMSHFANADSADDEVTLYQLERFRGFVERIRAAGFKPSVFHLANSAATLRYFSAHETLVRPGIALFGIAPSGKIASSVQLKPAFRLVTSIHQLKELPAGAGVSYGQTFKTKRKTKIGVLPVGYADGYPRLASNCGSVIIKGKRAPIVGVVCMDMTMVDVTDIEGVKRGDEVILIGKQGNEEITVEEVASWGKTVHYDILCGIGKRVPREWVQSNIMDV
ncbi:MAG: alanine racemase [Myxococcota bacterium]